MNDQNKEYFSDFHDNQFTAYSANSIWSTQTDSSPNEYSQWDENQPVSGGNGWNTLPNSSGTLSTADDVDALNIDDHLSPASHVYSQMESLLNEKQGWHNQSVNQSTEWNIRELLRNHSSSTESNVWTSHPPNGVNLWERFYSHSGQQTAAVGMNATATAALPRQSPQQQCREEKPVMTVASQQQQLGNHSALDTRQNELALRVMYMERLRNMGVNMALANEVLTRTNFDWAKTMSILKEQMSYAKSNGVSDSSAFKQSSQQHQPQQQQQHMLMHRQQNHRPLQQPQQQSALSSSMQQQPQQQSLPRNDIRNFTSPLSSHSHFMPPTQNCNPSSSPGVVSGSWDLVQGFKDFNVNANGENSTAVLQHLTADDPRLGQAFSSSRSDAYATECDRGRGGGWPISSPSLGWKNDVSSINTINQGIMSPLPASLQNCAWLVIYHFCAENGQAVERFRLHLANQFGICPVQSYWNQPQRWLLLAMNSQSQACQFQALLPRVLPPMCRVDLISEAEAHAKIAQLQQRIGLSSRERVVPSYPPY